MRTLWTIISVLAVANLIALAGFVGWLRNTDRLNLERVREARVMFSKTLAQEQADAEAQAKAQEAERVKAEQEKQASKPPLTAAEKLSARMEATELDRQRIERLKREVSDLKQQLAVERRLLNDEWASLKAQQQAFDDAIAAANAASTDAQFQKTLKVLSSQKPQQAVLLIKQMLADDQPPPAEFASVPLANGAAQPGAADLPAGPTEAQMNTVVAYLDAMNDKTRSKIIEALTKTDPRLAAELLERLRLRGEFARVP